MFRKDETFSAHRVERDEKTGKQILKKATYRSKPKMLFLGEGSHGSVCKAFLVKPDGNLDESKVVAVKKFAYPASPLNQQEAERLARYDIQAVPIKNEDDQTTHLVMEYKPGLTLIELYENGKPKNLNFSLAIHLIWQLALQINLLNRATLSTGNALIHKDIKAENIIVDLLARQLSLIDFGLSSELLEGDDPNQLISTHREGSFATITPEVFRYQTGTKSDSFAFAAIVMIMLTGRSPYSDRLRNQDPGQAFNMENFEEFTLPKDYPSAAIIKPLLIQFIKRNASLIYAERFNSDENLAFFTTLALCKKADPKTRAIYIAKLTLLTQGQWTSAMEKMDLFQLEHNDDEEKESKQRPTLKYKHSILCDNITKWHHLNEEDFTLGLACKFQLSVSTVMDATNRYSIKRRPSCFGWRLWGQSMESLECIRKLSAAKSDTARYEIAMNYLIRYPEKLLAKYIREAMVAGLKVGPKYTDSQIKGFCGSY